MGRFISWLRRPFAARSPTSVDLAEVNRSYMDMLEFVTHELKSPLASSLFAIDSIRSGLLGEVSEQQQRSLESVERNLEYLNEMINNYLNVSRIEKDELGFTPVEVRFLADLVAPAVEQVQGQLEASCMAIDCQIPEEITVTGDPELLRIVLDNLLSNAVKYGSPGSAIRLRHLGRRGKLERFSVWNAGFGVSRANQPKLFKKFSRLNVRELRAKKGTGLGLFITRSIVERHKGRIWVESNEGEWAEFLFEVPGAPSRLSQGG